MIHESTCENLCRTVIGRDAFYNAADMLNTVNFYGEGDIGKAISSLENPGNGNGISVIISDFLTDSDWKSAVDYLLYHKREVYLIQVLSRDELTPNLNGKILLLDSEAYDEDDERNYRSEITRSSIKAYEEAFLYLQNDINTFCAARDVGFITVCSDESIEAMLFQKATEMGVIQ